MGRRQYETQQPDPDHTGKERCPLCDADLRLSEEERRSTPGMYSRRVKIMDHQGYFTLWLCPFCRGTWERVLWN